MISKSQDFNVNYAAKIVEITEFRDHSNPEVERLKCCKVDGFNIITGIDSQPGLYVYFPTECSISPKFLHSNNLYKRGELNANPEETGMFEEKGRVKVINLKKEKSEGFVIPAQNLVCMFDDPNEFKLESLTVNEDFDTINGIELCRKYVPKNTQTSGAPGSGKGKQAKKTAEAEIVEGQFRFHVDTTLLRKCPYVIKPESLISITDKVHGTSAISSNVIIKRPVKRNFLQWLTRRPKFVEEYHDFFTSRKVVKDPLLNPSMADVGWYGGGDNKGRKIIHDEIFKPVLDKGITIYYEIIGYWPDGGAIQGKYDYGYVIPTSNEWTLGKHYGVEVYRITYTNPEGKVYEFSAKQVQQWCERNNIPAVKELYYGLAKDIYPELDITMHWNETLLEALSNEEKWSMEGRCPRCKNKVPKEGIVIRIEDLNINVYKLKCFAFLEGERKSLDKGEVDIESIG